MIFKPSKHDRPAFGKLANEYGLTYYGTIIPTEIDDYTPVRGITASPEQVDDNYTTGQISGREVCLLQRSHDVYLADNRRVNRTWTICQTTLIQSDLPHFLIGGKNKVHGDESALASYLRMYEIDVNSLGCPIAEDFTNKFAIYVSPQDIQTISPAFSPEMQAMLSLHFADTDFEIDGQRIYTYTQHRPATLTDLDKQLRATVWFANHLDRLNINR